MPFRIENNILEKYKENPSVTKIIIPKRVRSIRDSAFSNCKYLTSITIPEGVTSIGNGAFNECKNLTSITIPKGVRSIGEFAFSDCKNLTSINIPKSVTSIANHAFAGCKSLTDITIPKSVKRIGSWAFYDCGNLISEDNYNMFCNMTKDKDFSVKFDRSVKYPLILEWYRQKDDADAAAYIEKNLSKMVEYVTDKETFLKLLSDKLVSAATFNKILIFNYDSKNEESKKLFQSLVMKDENEAVTAMIKKNIKPLMKHMIDAEDMAAIYHLIKIECVTDKNIDELLDYAKVNEKHEPFITILHYKHEKSPYLFLSREDEDKKFMKGI